MCGMKQSEVTQCCNATATRADGWINVPKLDATRCLVTCCTKCNNAYSNSDTCSEEAPYSFAFSLSLSSSSEWSSDLQSLNWQRACNQRSSQKRKVIETNPLKTSKRNSVMGALIRKGRDITDAIGKENILLSEGQKEPRLCGSGGYDFYRIIETEL